MRRRLLSAASTLAFGLGVTMAGSMGVAGRAWAAVYAPIPATVADPRRDPFGDRVVPTAPPGRPPPAGPAPGVRVSRVELPRLDHFVTPPPKVTVLGFLVTATAAFAVAAFVGSWVERSNCSPGFIELSVPCGTHLAFEPGVALVAAVGVFVLAGVVAAISRAARTAR